MTELIDRLVDEHQPRKVLPAPEKRAWILICAGAAFAWLILTVIGRRQDWVTEEVEFYFLGEVIILGGLLVSSIYAVLQSVVPGEPADRTRLWQKIFLGAWLFYLVLGTVFGITPDMPLEGMSCLAIIGLGSIAPMVLLLLEAKRGITLNPKATGCGITLAAAAIAVLGLEAHCQWESALHHIVFHFLPAAAIGLLGFKLASLLQLPDLRPRKQQ